MEAIMTDFQYKSTVKSYGENVIKILTEFNVPQEVVDEVINYTASYGVDLYNSKNKTKAENKC